MDFILTNFGDALRSFGLYGAITNVQFSLLHSAYHLYSVLKMFNLHSDTFFSLVGELGFALHEMFKVSLLSMEELPYEEYTHS